MKGENPSYGPHNGDYEYDRRRQENDELVDAAFRDILAGNFDSQIVHDALQLGYHPEYTRLREQRDVAERIARRARAA